MVLGWLAISPAAQAIDPLPEGPTGIASKYVDDEGIGDDPEVILFDDFESYAVSQDLDALWESVYQYDQIAFDTEDPFAGAQSLRFSLPQQGEELANSVTKWISPEPDAMFLRYYTKFDAPFDVVGSSHNGGMIASHYFNGHDATPGIPADGTNKWLVTLENWRGEPETMSPGLLNVYVYHPEQRDNYGDHFFPSGLVMPNTSLPYDFGPDFVPFPEVIQPLQEWACMELMVVANTPGMRDGRIAAWIDGELVADWQNIRLRDVPELTIDRIWLAFHAGSNPNGETYKWYDNVVAASSYIGPIGDGQGGGSDGGSTGEGGSTGVDTSGGGGASSVSASGGDGGSEGATTMGASSTASAEAGTGGSEGGDASQDGDESGCGCTHGRARAPWLLIGLVAIARFGRRRRDR
jgi:hypothetical protein